MCYQRKRQAKITGYSHIVIVLYQIKSSLAIKISTKLQTPFRTGIHTLSAPDTFRRHGNFLHGKRHRTGFLAGHTGDTLVLLPPDSDQAEPVKPSVYRAQRTQILTERPIYFHRQQQKKYKDSKLPEKKSSNLTAQRLVTPKQRQRTEQSSGRTQVLTECRYLGESAEQKGRTNTHQKNQNHILSIFQNMMKRQSLSFPEQRNLM